MPKRILFPWEVIYPGDWNRTFLRKAPHTKPTEEEQTQRGQQDPIFIIKTAMPNRTIQKISLNKKTIKDMANHIIGEKMSKYDEKIFDADGDGKITLKDFIHRIKNVAGVESRNKIEIESFEEKISRKRLSHQ